MSKIKSAKRKSTCSLKSNAKLPAVKLEVDTPNELCGNNNADILNSDSTSMPSTSYSKSNTKLPTTCEESASNANLNRESTDTFSSYMKNAILEEVLNSKKAALLQSPSVMKLLREEQMKKQKKD